MTKQIFVGLITEGPTDIRFLDGVINRSLREISFDCYQDVEIFDVLKVNGEGDSFVEKMEDALKNSSDKGISILFIHCDSDAKELTTVVKNKIQPLRKRMEALSPEQYCKIIVPTIPIRMIESWMLADKPLLKRFIQANTIPDYKLGLEKQPEKYSDPKDQILKAIRIAHKDKKSGKQPSISELYEVLGNKIPLERLRSIPSYVAFEENIRTALREMHLMA